ncbi:hypothetical protein [Sphingobium amiense]|uniref:hypothetical protein n=1 Tax=Sphingobium amiense TaxID=135719 RepID=UPI001C3F36F8|nr:hypothetical protein [Sphingobium amiense]
MSLQYADSRATFGGIGSERKTVVDVVGRIAGTNEVSLDNARIRDHALESMAAPLDIGNAEQKICRLSANAYGEGFQSCLIDLNHAILRF